MSVQQIKPEVFGAVLSALHTSTFQRECNINFIDGMSKKTEDELKDFIRTLCIMNEKSICGHYNGKRKHFENFLNLSIGFNNNNAYQLLKWLQCIDYNIEPEWWKLSGKERKALKELKRIIDSVNSNIIGSIPEYEKALWNETAI